MESSAVNNASGSISIRAIQGYIIIARTVYGRHVISDINRIACDLSALFCHQQREMPCVYMENRVAVAWGKALDHIYI